MQNIINTCHTSGMYANRACLFHANVRESSSEMATSSGNSLFAKALSCAVSVVKANHIQDGAATNCAQRDISVFMATTGLFGKSICYLSF